MEWPAWLVRGYIRKILRPIEDRLGDPPFARLAGPPVLALLSSCGVHRTEDPPFVMTRVGDPTFRHFPVEVVDEAAARAGAGPVEGSGSDPGGLTISHGHYDEDGVRADVELAYPVSAVRRLVEEGVVKALHPTLHSFRGSFQDVLAFLDRHSPAVADELEAGAVEAALITPC